MMKSIFFRLLILMNILVFRDAFARDEDSILTSISNKLSDYTAKIPREEIFIHQDKQEYIAGEDMWLKIFLIDRHNNKLSDRSSLVYFEILNSDAQPVIQKRILLKNGTGPSHLILPDTLRTGFYTVRAYTNWMKNFLPYNCFLKEFVVFNTLKKEIDDIQVTRRKAALPLQKNPTDSEFKLHLKHGNNDSLEIMFEFTGTYSDTNSPPYYLIIQSRGNISYSAKLPADKKMSVCLPESLLQEGINQVVIFNKREMPVAEKLFYIPVKKNEILGITPENFYKPGNNIRIDLQFADTSTLIAAMSMSVSPLSHNRKVSGIQDFLVFGSEFNSEAGYISENILDGLTISEADSVLSGLRSNWIRWTEIIDGRIPALTYSPEKEYHFLRGSLTNGKFDTILILTPGRNNSFEYTLTDSIGNFTFRVNPGEEEKDLILIPQSNDGNKKIILFSSFPLMNIDPGRSYSSVISPKHFSRAGTDFQVRKIFGTTTSENETNHLYTPLKPACFYGIPDIEVNLRDYIELPTMEEVFFELVPGVSLQKNKNGYEIMIVKRINDRRFEMNPVVMIDGIIVKDLSLVAELDPGLVETIHVINNEYLVGGYLFDGIVNLITRSADFSNIPQPEHMVRMRYRITETVSSFYNPGNYDPGKKEFLITGMCFTGILQYGLKSQ